MKTMKVVLHLMIPALLFCGPFDTPKYNSQDMSVFNTKILRSSKEGSEEKKVSCRIVCDKKIHKVQQISEALSFYKRTRSF